MSAERQMFPPPRSPSFPAGLLEALGGSEPRGSPPPLEMETLRMFVNERLTAAVDDILGAFGQTVARYREQIDRQQRQLDVLRPGEGSAPSWIKTCPEDEVQADGVSAVTVKTEGVEDGVVVSESLAHFDPAAGSEAASDGRLVAVDTDTEDSEDYWTEAAGLWRPDQTGGGQSSVSVAPAQQQQQHPPLFSCRVCGETFRKMSYLRTHCAAHLRDCGVCGKQLQPGGESLKLHLRVHRETAFRCAVCGQNFTQRGNLRTHMRIHSGERPFGCTVCGKKFGRRATLVRHVRSHTGEKPYSCSFCERSFVEKGNLTVHLRTHTGEKPYWCSVCDRRFNQLSSLYKHPCQRGRGLQDPAPSDHR
ncbi:uncharacterized protein [Brachyistius frenatus]|uniref:uncharacterized protein n=1 Tax=Brachyistius frenatus TaxID=100188 RepID=UPI0037E7B2FC